MMARVKWNEWSGLGVNARKVTANGTLLAFVFESHNTVAMVACDGDPNNPQGKIVRKEVGHLTVTTWFKWL